MSEMLKPINVVYLYVVLPSSCDKSNLDKLSDYCSNRYISGLVMKNLHLLLCSSIKPMNLKNGMDTLRRIMELEEIPQRIKGDCLLPNSFIHNQFPNGYDPELTLRKFGEKFCDDYIISVLDNKRANLQRKNEQFLTTDTWEAVMRGDIDAMQAQPREERKRFLTDLAEKREYVKNPLLNGMAHFVFEQRKRASDGKLYLTKKFAPVEVEFTGHPDDMSVKRRHYYIYSRQPGFGKSHMLEKFAEKWNAFIVGDLNNWYDVPENIQFLLVDEIGPKRKIDISILKAITAGTKKTAGLGNKKTHGASYKFRSDVQFIFASNNSPYEVYGSWHNGLQRNIMSADEMDQFEDRFEVIRLDGDVNDDKAAYMCPKDWSDELYDQQKTLTVQRIGERYKNLASNPSEDYIVALVEIIKKKLIPMFKARYEEDPVDQTMALFKEEFGHLKLDEDFTVSDILKELYNVEMKEVREYKNRVEAYLRLNRRRAINRTKDPEAKAEHVRARIMKEVQKESDPEVLAKVYRFLRLHGGELTQDEYKDYYQPDSDYHRKLFHLAVAKGENDSYLTEQFVDIVLCIPDANSPWEIEKLARLLLYINFGGGDDDDDEDYIREWAAKGRVADLCKEMVQMACQAKKNLKFYDSYAEKLKAKEEQEAKETDHYYTEPNSSDESDTEETQGVTIRKRSMSDSSGSADTEDGNERKVKQRRLEN